MDISHEEYNTILEEKDKYQKMKENVRNISEKLEEEKQENKRLNSMNSRTTSMWFVKNYWIIENLRHYDDYYDYDGFYDYCDDFY